MTSPNLQEQKSKPTSSPEQPVRTEQQSSSRAQTAEEKALTAEANEGMEWAAKAYGVPIFRKSAIA